MLMLPGGGTESASDTRYTGRDAVNTAGLAACTRLVPGRLVVNVHRVHQNARQHPHDRGTSQRTCQPATLSRRGCHFAVLHFTVPLLIGLRG